MEKGRADDVAQLYERAEKGLHAKVINAFREEFAARQMEGASSFMTPDRLEGLKERCFKKSS